MEATEYFVGEKITSAEAINEMLWKEGKQNEASNWIPQHVFVRVNESSPVDGRPLFETAKRLYKRSEFLAVLDSFEAKRMEAFESWARGQNFEKKQAPYFWSPRMISDVETNTMNWRDSGYDDPPSVQVKATTPVFKIVTSEVKKRILGVYDVLSNLESMEGIHLTMSVVEGDEEEPEQKAEEESVDISKYKKMLDVGLSRGAVQQKMVKDGVDPKLLKGGVRLQLPFGNSPLGRRCIVKLFQMRAKSEPKEDLIAQMETSGCTPEEIAEVFPPEEEKNEEEGTVTIRLPRFRVEYTSSSDLLDSAVKQLVDYVSQEDGVESITMSVNGNTTAGLNIADFSQSAKHGKG